MRNKIFGIVHDQIFLQTAGRKIVPFAEVKLPQFLEVFHTDYPRITQQKRFLVVLRTSEYTPGIVPRQPRLCFHRFEKDCSAFKIKHTPQIKTFHACRGDSGTHNDG
jgi:hypothetical protein